MSVSVAVSAPASPVMLSAGAASDGCAPASLVVLSAVADAWGDCTFFRHETFRPLLLKVTKLQSIIIKYHLNEKRKV